MAKILVADDNSNVQKTVALALADLGVEVIGVNNGEAAVRKLGDISPNLILADIFMPVRNGYEVCEFVKRDSRFSKIPVVLLVGAFDPLDEREAQRVNADGILKKPFVPPDPLIAMVKTLLDRTLGERVVAVGASKPAAAAENKAGGVAIAEKPIPAPETSEEELPLQEFRPPVDRLSFGDGEHPVAFQQLLETAAQTPVTTGQAVVEPVDDDQILTSSRPASLGDPIFWRTESPNEQSGEENSEADQETGTTPDLSMSAWKPDSEALSHAKEGPLQPVDPFELVRDETEEEAKQAPTIAESSSLIVQDAASQASLTVEPGKPDDLAANPIEWMASVPPPKPDETPEADSEWPAASIEAIPDRELDAAEPSELKNDTIIATPESAAKVATPAVLSVPKPQPPPFPTPAQPPIRPLAQGLEDTTRSTPNQDWADLASGLQAKSLDSGAEKAKSSTATVAQPPTVISAHHDNAAINSAPPSSKSLTPAAENTARSTPEHDWADLAASIEPDPMDAVNEKAKPLPSTPPQPSGTTSKRPESAPKNSAPQISKPLSQNVEDTARSIPKQALADLAATLEPKSIEHAADKPKPSPVPGAQIPAMTGKNADIAPANSAPTASNSPTQDPDDTARSIPKHDWADLTANVQAKSSEAVVVKPKPAAPLGQAPAGPLANSQPANSSPNGSPDPALVEAVVQRVLEKMRPQVVDIITKEFLRPVVQALVHREITKR